MNRLDEYIEKMFSLKYFIGLPVRKITFFHLTNPEMCPIDLKFLLQAKKWILWDLIFLLLSFWPTVN